MIRIFVSRLDWLVSEYSNYDINPVPEHTAFDYSFPDCIKMPNCGTWKVPFRGKFGPYTEGRRIVPPFSVQVRFSKVLKS